MRLVVIFAFEKANLLDITGPVQVFATASDVAVALGASERPYEVVVASMSGGLVRTSCGLEIMTGAVSELEGRQVDTMLASGGGALAAARDRETVQWVAGMRDRTRRIGSICTGAFLMAAAGVLEGRRATTHWVARDDLRRRYPGVRVESDALFIEDGGVWTSAGVAAGIDMALAMVEQDSGSALALETARQLVLFLKRSGGQPQFSSFLQAQTISDDNLRKLLDWILQNPGLDLDASVLAKRANMSLRSLFRAFKEHLDTSPREFVERARLETARRSLEQSSERIDRVALKAGFSSAVAMRSAFKRHFQVSPASYRERFSVLKGDHACGDAISQASAARVGARRI